MATGGQVANGARVLVISGDDFLSEAIVHALRNDKHEVERTPSWRSAERLLPELRPQLLREGGAPVVQIVVRCEHHLADEVVEDGFDVGRVAIGQGGLEGAVEATPLQMALVAATVANGGRLMKPRLTDRVVFLSEPRATNGVTYWLEGRPDEEGRQVLVRREVDGSVAVVTPRRWEHRLSVLEGAGDGRVVGEHAGQDRAQGEQHQSAGEAEGDPQLDHAPAREVAERVLALGRAGQDAGAAGDGLALLQATPRDGPLSAAAQDTARSIRSIAADEAGASRVGGASAEFIDFKRSLVDHAPIVAALAALAQACAPDALLVVTVPAMPSLTSRWDEVSGHRRRYTRGLLRRHLREGGWTPGRTRYLFAYAVPPVWVQRRLLRRVQEFEFPDVSPLVNRLLTAAGAVERALGCPFPFGTSLLAVARRS